MPSQFSAIGFHVTSGEDLATLASRVADRTKTITVAEGQYLQWAPPSGEQLWLQVRKSGDAMGMTPHFEGRSVVRIVIEARIRRPSQTPLEGTFLAWANPQTGTTTPGDYPFAFDCPDAAVHENLSLPFVTTAQIAAFAQRLTIYESVEVYDRETRAQGMNFPSQSFIPSGLFLPSGEPVNPPEPHALLAGHIVEAEERRNAVTGEPFCWALVHALGGTFDVVIDPELLQVIPRPGQVLSGWFWLTGRLKNVAATEARGGWLRRLTGR